LSELHIGQRPSPAALDLGDYIEQYELGAILMGVWFLFLIAVRIKVGKSEILPWFVYVLLSAAGIFPFLFGFVMLRDLIGFLTNPANRLYFLAAAYAFVLYAIVGYVTAIVVYKKKFQAKEISPRDYSEVLKYFIWFSVFSLMLLGVVTELLGTVVMILMPLAMSIESLIAGEWVLGLLMLGFFLLKTFVFQGRKKGAFSLSREKASDPSSSSSGGSSGGGGASSDW